MDAESKKEFNRLRALKNNKFSDAEIEHQVKIKMAVRKFRSNPLFENNEVEQKLAEEKFQNYITVNEIESENDLDILRSLVYNEIFEMRIQKEINELTKDVEDLENPGTMKKKFFPDRLTGQLTEIQNQKLSLKVKLGIGLEKKDKDELTGLLTLKARFSKHINANKHEFTMVAPDGTPLLLRKRVEDFDSMEHPWFAGRWFFNYEIFKDVKDGKLSKEDAWRYLCCASQGGDYKPAFDKKYCTDYIDYCLKHWAEITEFLSKK